MTKRQRDPAREALQAEYAALRNRAVRSEERICFGLAWFTTEAEAERLGELNRSLGNTVNGGWYDGMVCGRSSEFDYKGDGQTLYACRT